MQKMSRNVDCSTLSLWPSRFWNYLLAFVTNLLCPHFVVLGAFFITHFCPNNKATSAFLFSGLLCSGKFGFVLGAEGGLSISIDPALQFAD